MKELSWVSVTNDFSQSVAMPVTNIKELRADQDGVGTVIYYSDGTSFKTTNTVANILAQITELREGTAKRIVTLLVSDPNGAALTTGEGKAYFRIPAELNGYNLISVSGSADTVSSSGLPSIGVRRKRSGADAEMLSTNLTLDANENDSSTAATAMVVDGANDDVATADRIYIDCDAAGTGTKGVEVQLVFQLP
jgi:hypothetical protein